MARTDKDKMLEGELYNAGAPEIQAELAATHRWLARYNAALDMAPADRRALLLERLAAVGEGAMIRPPFHCDYGFNIRLGAGVFLNFNCIILDVVEVSIGDGTQIGPGVQILAADHPRDPTLRASGLEFGRPVHIGRNVWIGRERSLYRASPLLTMRSSALAAWSPGAYRQARPPSATRLACSLRGRLGNRFCSYSNVRGAQPQHTRQCPRRDRPRAGPGPWTSLSGWGACNR